MTGMIQPEIKGFEEVGVGRTWPSQGNGAPRGSVGSGEKSMVSDCASFVITSTGVVTRRPVASLLMMERSVGREKESFTPVVVLRNDSRATLGFLTNMRRRALPYSRHVSGHSR